MEDALNEARTLILGTQVLLGFQYQSAFEPGFPRLGFEQAIASLAALVALLANFALLVLPITSNLLVDRGTDTAREYRLTTNCVALALPLFALAVGIDIEVALASTIGTNAAVTVGTFSGVLALGLWFGIRPATRRGDMSSEEQEEVPLKDKIKQVLTETRVVLPGAQALLGFAGITTLLDAFNDLPMAGRYMHLVGLCAVALSMLLLMTPAAVHRIAEHGDASESFYRLAGFLVLAGLAALAISLAAEVFVVFLKVSGSLGLAVTAGLVCLAGFAALWFAWPVSLARRRR